MRLKPRRKHEQSPNAVDDAGDPGEQFDSYADAPPQPVGTNLGQKERNAETDGNTDQHGNERRDHRAVNRWKRSELLGDGIPPLREDELPAKGLPG